MGRIVERARALLDRQGGWGRIGFYTSGQLALEEYYTLAVIGKAGIGTPHMDGNTRLCTATAAAALKETFGTDGQPGSYRDVDFCDALALWGHNVAETQTVLWSRMLDRRRGPNPPRLLVVDPRPTAVAREADVHLAVRPGTNVALLHGLLNELIARGAYDSEYLRRHTVGFDRLARTVAAYPLALVAEICDIPVDRLEAATELLADSKRLLSTVLQGLYQANQATAAACLVNAVHLIRGMTHAMQIFRYAEAGSIELLWISATNPAVSLPDLARIRRVLAKDDLFVVVQDLYLTETAQFADVVLPAATRGEKVGTFTNADRTVHLSDKAVEPPGEAKPDLDIFLDFARRMEFRNRDGNPLIAWNDAESAFEAWKACSRGRPCDHSGFTYERLRGGSGIPWPCTIDEPHGIERLYDDGRFHTDADECEDSGHDLTTGASRTESEYRALAADGRAILPAVEFEPPPEQPSSDWPIMLTTGRTLYHFHTRTKTGRAPQLDQAAPNVWVEIAPADAEPIGIGEGDIVRIESPRGGIQAPARLCDVRPGTVFVPFHYGDGDIDRGASGHRAANELTVTLWDPVSKQPMFKAAAVRLSMVATGHGPAPAPTTGAARPLSDARVPPTAGGGTGEATSHVGNQVV
jgi:anaerobic selenocysteine-containing dehydrogenase